MRKAKRLGRYQLTERIAFGGMAEIFRGFTFDAQGFRHDVAIKQLLPNYAEDKVFLTMLADEYRLVSMLKHPNIAEVYELSELADSVLIAMEFVDGKDLRTTVEKAKRLDTTLRFDDICYIMARALDGLHHAHEASDRNEHLNIVHRDFSPSNILVAYDGLVKICDFGIAKATLSRVQTRTGIIKGKVKYMSPEQAFGRRLDRRSDVFSAGSVLYELCTGRAAFVGKSEVDLIFSVRDANPAPAKRLNPHIPSDLCEVMDKAMQRSRSDRYESAKQFRNALLKCLKRYNPNYKRTRLARFMKRLWEEEIERDLRILEDYAVDLSPIGDLGRNLIADVLGPNPRYADFSPQPTHAGETRVTKTGSKNTPK